MPISFLNSFEKQQYQDVPQDIQEDILVQFFYLTENDLRFIKSFYTPISRIAIGILIGLIRYLGYVPDNWKEKLSSTIFNFIGEQLKYNISLATLTDYGRREQTQTEHLRQILIYLKFRKWQPLLDSHVMEQWLIEKGMVHDKERYLLDLLCQKLYQEKILRPSIGTLEAIVGGIRETLAEETYNRLSLLWTDSFVDRLDNILETDQDKKITPHRWLCNIPGGNTSRNINQMLEKYDFLTKLGVQSWDLSCLSENRKKKLAFLVKTDSNAHLKRMPPIRKYPMLVCFLNESLLNITDIILVMYNDYWQQIINKSKRSLDNHLVKNIKSQHRAIKTITKIGQIVVDENVAIFKNLQKFQSVGLVMPVDVDHMYFAAMNSKSCRLTALGYHYWRLVKDKRI